MAVVPVHVAGTLVTGLMPPPELLLRAGQAAKLAETDCDAPVMVSVAVQVCGPVPNGGDAPVLFTRNFHCVPLGSTTLLSARRAVKLPVESSPIGDMLPVKPTPFSVGEVPPGTTSDAEIVPPA